MCVTCGCLKPENKHDEKTLEAANKKFISWPRGIFPSKKKKK
jgi:hypothetical protein